ncbi:MAG: Dyp-type peroxidase [Trebonia sp.]|uniref:Dyp-type peroxidase n=1 Tax=Trebonia sp. TaxID=2767075 RepID=UPI003C74E727
MTSEPEQPVQGEAAATPGRRSFLRGMAGGVAGGVVAGGVAGGFAGYAYRGTAADPAAAANAAAVQGRLPAVPFHGKYQAGILPAPQRATAVVSFTATASSRAELAGLFQTATDRARFLTAGGTPPPVGIDGPPSDSGVLGPTVIPDGLTVTFGVGSTLFDSRYGLAASRPLHLTPMKSFPNDDLDPAQCGGDIVLQLSAGNTDTVLHALRDIAKNTRGGMQANWRIDGFSSPARPAGTVPRNLLGFMDGIANPAVTSAAQMDSLVWVNPPASGEPAWAAGGTYFVVRLIRMFVEFWDRVDIEEQETMIGRRRGTGFPLDGTSVHSIPDYPADPTGDVIPLTAHMRLANPRTPETASSVILRRAYNYNRGLDAVGDLDMGLLFTCFQQDIKRQFETVQTRLIGEPLVDYISPFGGGYFLALPGVTGPSDFYGRSLLA